MFATQRKGVFGVPLLLLFACSSSENQTAITLAGRVLGLSALGDSPWAGAAVAAATLDDGTLLGGSEADALGLYSIHLEANLPDDTLVVVAAANGEQPFERMPLLTLARVGSHGVEAALPYRVSDQNNAKRHYVERGGWSVDLSETTTATSVLSDGRDDLAGLANDLAPDVSSVVRSATDEDDFLDRLAETGSARACEAPPTTSPASELCGQVNPGRNLHQCLNSVALVVSGALTTPNHTRLGRVFLNPLLVLCRSKINVAMNEPQLGSNGESVLDCRDAAVFGRAVDAIAQCGYGNCREHAYASTYCAFTRCREQGVRQVTMVGATPNAGGDGHAFVIVSTRDDFDLSQLVGQRLSDGTWTYSANGRQLTPEQVASLTVVDSWATGLEGGDVPIAGLSPGDLLDSLGEPGDWPIFTDGKTIKESCGGAPGGARRYGSSCSAPGRATGEPSGSLCSQCSGLCTAPEPDTHSECMKQGYSAQYCACVAEDSAEFCNCREKGGSEALCTCLTYDGEVEIDKELCYCVDQPEPASCDNCRSVADDITCGCYADSYSETTCAPENRASLAASICATYNDDDRPGDAAATCCAVAAAGCL